MFCTILYLSPTTPMTDLVLSNVLITACRLRTGTVLVIDSHGVTCSLYSACMSCRDTFQSSPACRAASDAEPASTAVPPRFQALRLLLTVVVIAPSLTMMLDTQR